MLELHCSTLHPIYAILSQLNIQLSITKCIKKINQSTENCWQESLNYVFVIYFKNLYKTLELEALALICAI